MHVIERIEGHCEAQSHQREGGTVLQHVMTRPSWLLSGLLAQSELRELLDLLYGELQPERGPLSFRASEA